MVVKVNQLAVVVLATFIIAGKVDHAACEQGVLFNNFDNGLNTTEVEETAKNALQLKIIALQEEYTRLRGVLVFVSAQNNLFSVNSKSLESKILSKVDDGFIVATDYDPVDDMLYWRTNTGKLERMKRDGTDRSTIMTGIGEIGGIAIDWISRNLYWTDENSGQIFVANLNKRFQTRLIVKDLNGPRGIAVDPKAGKMYWTEWKSNPRVASALLDGSDVEVLVQDVQWPNGIALDRDRKLVYFADAKRERIDVVGMDGKRRKVFLDNFTPQVFALSFSSGDLYWTDWRTERAERIRTTNGPSDRETILVSSKRMMAITAASMKPMPGTNPCANGNGGCSHFCFYTGQTVKCSCPDETDVDPKSEPCSEQ